MPILNATVILLLLFILLQLGTLTQVWQNVLTFFVGAGMASCQTTGSAQSLLPVLISQSFFRDYEVSPGMIRPIRETDVAIAYLSMYIAIYCILKIKPL